MGTSTPIRGLYKPAHAEVGWDAAVNANMDNLDTAAGANIDNGAVTDTAGQGLTINTATSDVDVSSNSRLGLSTSGTQLVLDDNNIALGGASFSLVAGATTFQTSLAGNAVTLNSATIDFNASTLLDMSGSASVIAPTPAPGNNSTKVATTAFVATAQANGYANSTLATATVAQSSTTLKFKGQYWNGSASALDEWDVQDVVGNGTNGTSTLTFTHSGSTATPTVSMSGMNLIVGQSITGTSDLNVFNSLGSQLTLRGAGGGEIRNSLGTNLLDLGYWHGAGTGGFINTVASTATVSQSGLTVYFDGTYWNGSASAVDSWTVQNVVANGTNGASTLTFTHSGTSGAAAVSIPGGSFGTQTGLIFAGGNIALSAASTVLAINGNGGNPNLRFYNSGTLASEIANTTSGGIVFGLLQTYATASSVIIAGFERSNTNGCASVYLGAQGGNSGALIGTSGTQVGVSVGNASGGGAGVVPAQALVQFSPTSGTANLVAFQVNPGINQTGTASGSYTALLVNVVETALLGSANKLLSLQAGVSGGTTKFQVNNSGVIDTANGETTAGVGSPYLRGVTSQKSETGTDASVLSVTPGAVAGSYRLRVVISVSAASAATLGWTATWTDSNGNAQTPTNLALTQSGALPALTFTTSAAGNYYGEADIDINNAGTPIVIKTTFAGTSVAYKVTATIERIV
jgi:hypothetical protein